MAVRSHQIRVWSLLFATVFFSGVIPAAFAAPPHFGEAPPDTLVYTNPFEILVTASRLVLPLKQSPSAMTVIGGDALRVMPRGVAVDEALRLVPGVRIDNQMNGERVHMSIRGQGILTERGIRGIKVLLDGLPVNDPTGVAPDLYDVEWGMTDRIEVLRGPAAALYGGGGSGGVVNIETQHGAGRPGGGSLSTVAGSNNFYKTQIATGAAGKSADYQLSASRTTGDGWRDHTAFRATDIYGKIHWKPAPEVKITQIFGWTDYFDQNAEGLSFTQVRENPEQANPDAGSKNEYYRTRRFTDGVLANIALSRDQELNVVGYLRVTQFKMPVPAWVQHRSFLSPGATVQYALHTGRGSIRNHVTAGGDFMWQGIDQYGRTNIGGAVEDSLLSNEHIGQRGVGVFVLDRVELGKQFGVMASGRYDDIHNQLTDYMPSPGRDHSGEKDFNKATARLGLAYTPLRELNLYGNVAQGFLPPTTEELGNNPDDYGGFNGHLKSATSFGEEFGARGLLTSTLSYEATLFHLDTKNDFGRYRLPSPRDLETFYNNAGSSRRYGAETLVQWKPIRSVTLKTAYTYSHFKYTAPDSIDGNWLPNSPQHILAVDLAYGHSSGFFCGISTDTQSNWYVNTENKPASFKAGDPQGSQAIAGEPATVDGFTLVGARIGWRWWIGGRDGEFTLSVRNIFDEKYMGFTEPDKDGNSYQPGPGREFFFGLRLNAPR